ncbi:MAG: thioesterase family protein [Acidobacteriota bacterium]
MYELHTTRQIEFADTDMAGIVHFSRFFVFMETAEHEFLTALGITVHFDYQGRRIGWPRVAASCQYRSPARLGDVLDLLVRVKRKGRSSLTWAITIRCGERLIAEGELSTICCALDGPTLEPIPIPPFLADQIEEAPKEVES